MTVWKSERSSHGQIAAGDKRQEGGGEVAHGGGHFGLVSRVTVMGLTQHTFRREAMASSAVLRLHKETAEIAVQMEFECILDSCKLERRDNAQDLSHPPT
jgi:hypothetical protein